MASQMSSDPALWRWVVEGGEPQVGTEDELIRQLSTGRVPPYALVWREGWAEWLPAMQVEALAEAFPELSLVGLRAARPSLIPGIPPVPVGDYPRLRHLAKDAPLGWPDSFEGPEKDVITSEVPVAAMLEAARVMTEPSPPHDLGLQEAIERASRLPPAAIVSSDSGRTPMPGPALPLATELGLEALLAEAAPSRSWSHWLRAHGLWLALLLVGLGLGAVFALRWFDAGAGGMRRVLSSVAPLSPLASSSTPSRRVAVALGCRFRQPPIELDDWAVVDVRPVLHPLASGQEIAIGYAQSHRSAAGGIIDVASLRLDRQFWQQQDRQIFSVTPLEVGGALRYHVERQGTNVAFARAVAAEPPARLGEVDDGLALGPLDQRAQRLWGLPAGSSITVPEVAEHPLGFTLALRSARNLDPLARGAIGHLHVALITSAGSPLAPLTDVGNPEWDFGRPALASGPEQTVLAACHRGGEAQADELMLARARNGQLPTQLRRFELPAPAAPELNAPVLAALPDGGFVLMWSQGPSTGRQVRLQRLSAELAPLGPAFDVTSAAPAGANATAAALHWVNDRLLAFYFDKRDAGHSLWVGSVSCGA